MTDRLNEIKERLAKVGVTAWRRQNSDVYMSDYHRVCIGDVSIAQLITHCPSDIAWLIAELEKERAEHDSTLQINRELEEAKRELQERLNEHLGEQPKVCADCIKNYHTICQWEIEYKPGCVCGCHLARVIR